jgi:hypothetical protein
MSIVVVESQSLGEDWLRVSRAILEDGALATYDGQPTRELALLTLTVAHPDFWLRDGAVELVVYAHSLDFGKKAYGNLVELARLQDHVAGALSTARGSLVVHCKSAHVYEPEWSLMASLAERGPAPTLR